MIARAIVSLTLASVALQQPASEEVISRLFAATSAGPYVSYSWGEQWSRLREGIRGFEGRIDAFICLGPAVYAGGVEGVFVSEDYGENYVPLAAFPAANVTVFLTARLFELEPTIWVGTMSGLYRSTDGGGEFVHVGASDISSAVRALAWPGPELFAATDGGLFVSVDTGERWTRLDRGLPAAPVLSIVVSQYFLADPKVIVGTGGAGLHRSEDGGKTFAPAGGRAMSVATVNALYWWGSVLIIGTDDGLYLSHDAGDSVEEVEELDGRAIYAISVPAPDAPLSDILVGTDRGVYQSSDGGGHFRLVQEGMGSPSVTALATFPPPPQSRELPR